MSKAISCCFMLLAFGAFSQAETETFEVNAVKTVDTSPPKSKPLPRRYEINDLGYQEMFHGWADAQGQGAANDYCRMVGHDPKIYLACALAGTHGESEYEYRSDNIAFDRGYVGTWYMRDEDGDGRDDYCRCMTKSGREQVVCTKAGPKGFYGSPDQGGKTYTFTTTGDIICNGRKVNPEMGRAVGGVLE